MNKLNYYSYIKSEEWRKTRKRFFKSKLFKNCCFCCGSKSEFYHIHHKSYKSFGKENLNHLAAICKSCHKMIHKLVNCPQFKTTIWGAATRLNKLINEHTENKIALKQKKYLNII